MELYKSLVLFDLGLTLGKYVLMGLGVLYIVNFVKAKLKK